MSQDEEKKPVKNEEDDYDWASHGQRMKDMFYQQRSADKGLASAFALLFLALIAWAVKLLFFV